MLLILQYVYYHNNEFWYLTTLNNRCFRNCTSAIFVCATSTLNNIKGQELHISNFPTIIKWEKDQTLAEGNLAKHLNVESSDITAMSSPTVWQVLERGRRGEKQRERKRGTGELSRSQEPQAGVVSYLYLSTVPSPERNALHPPGHPCHSWPRSTSWSWSLECPAGTVGNKIIDLSLNSFKGEGRAVW